jgi:hypothetical protein
MTQGSTFPGPQAIDIGAWPPCSQTPVGSNDNAGTRCIYSNN